MKLAMLVILLGAAASAQSLVEHSAAAAGGAVGGVAGKKVSDGVTSIFQKLDKAAGKAAKTDAPAKPAEAPKGNPNDPVFEVSPGVPHARSAKPAPRSAARNEVPSVPPPPPLAHHAARKPAPAVETRQPDPVPQPVLAAPPPPIATRQDLQKIPVGETRADLLKLGFPAVHITMYDNGHLVEEFRFMKDDADIGIVRLTDGAVSNVQVN